MPTEQQSLFFVHISRFRVRDEKGCLEKAVFREAQDLHQFPGRLENKVGERLKQGLVCQVNWKEDDQGTCLKAGNGYFKQLGARVCSPSLVRLGSA